MMQQFFEYSDEVKQAIAENKPVLALESTLITHGLPFPKNKETALAVEKIARENGVVPATIAIMNKKIKIGLDKEDLDVLTSDVNVMKASIRDISYALSNNINAGTTVASTLFCAHHAGIKIFATGGIGGVHRGDAQDISADLIALAKTPMAVVCAGAKAILDLPKTLEFLETHSISIIGYRTNTFPAFYTAETKHQLASRVDDVASLAELLKTHWELNMSSGILVANPISIDEQIASDTIEPAISQALALAEKNGIQGKEITPFLLSEVAKATQGKSMKANIHLIMNNVRLGAQIAYQLSM